jgi:predicted RNA binding protein YcfA (HicA-like mRNA interferase family)
MEIGPRKKSIASVTIFSYTSRVTSLSDDLERLRRNPKGVRFADLDRMILRAGFTRDRSRGSHHVYVRAGQILTVVKPHGRHTTCHPRDVRDVIRFLEGET